MKATKLLLVIALLSPLMRAEAAFLTIEASEIVSIAPSDGSKMPRILVRWELPAGLSDKQVDAAGIRITLTTSGEGDLPLEIHQITRSWTAESVTWSSGWSTVGGDFSSRSLSPGLITERNNGTARMDVTSAVKDQIFGRASNFGFIIVPRQGSGRVLAAVSANDGVALTRAEMVIAYRDKRH